MASGTSRAAFLGAFLVQLSNPTIDRHRKAEHRSIELKRSPSRIDLTQ